MKCQGHMNKWKIHQWQEGAIKGFFFPPFWFHCFWSGYLDMEFLFNLQIHWVPMISCKARKCSDSQCYADVIHCWWCCLEVNYKIIKKATSERVREPLGMVMQYRAFHPEVSRSNPFQIRSDQQWLHVCFQIHREGLQNVTFISATGRPFLHLHDKSCWSVWFYLDKMAMNKYFMDVHKYGLIYSTKIIRVLIICPFCGPAQ